MAFLDCKNLRNVHFGSKPVKIGPLCFMGTAVKDLKLPWPVGLSAIELGVSLDLRHSIVLPEDKIQIGPEDVADKGAQLVFVPRNVQVLKANTFRGCWELRHVVFASRSHLRIIGAHAFAGTRVHSLSIPASVRKIGRGAFAECPRLQCLRLPDTLGALPAEMCMRTALRKIHIPSSARSIGDAAFYQCPFLVRRVLCRNNMLRVVGLEAFGET